MSKAWAGGGSRAWRRVRLFVLNRDDWVCRLCGRRIDPALRWPEPGSPSVHHTLGRAVTGDDPRYLVAAHWACNLDAGDPTRQCDPPPVGRTRW